MIKFHVQVNEKTNIPYTDTGIEVIESVEYLDWATGGRSDLSYRLVKGHEEEGDGSVVIPVGNLEFTASYLGRGVRAINVPEELDSMAYRKIGRGTREQLKEFMRTERLKEAFVKPNDYCKRFDAMLVKEEQLEQLNGELFWSEVIEGKKEIASEWRVFVYRGKIQDCRMYSGEWYSNTPDKEYIQKAVEKYRKCPLAYTLDVAVIQKENGEELTAILEVHNFIACGHYGFRDTRRITSMVIGAWKYEEGNSLNRAGLENVNTKKGTDDTSV